MAWNKRKRGKYVEYPSSDECEEVGDGFTRLSSGYSERFQKGVELKFLDFFFSTGDSAVDGRICADSGQYTGVNYVKQGTAANERIGTMFTIWRMRFILSPYLLPYSTLPTFPTSTFSALFTSAVRVFLVLDKQCNGQLPTFEDIFSVDLTAGPGGNFRRYNVWSSFENTNNSERFSILHEEILTLKPRIMGSGVDGSGNEIVWVGGDQEDTADHLDFEGGLDIDMSGTEGQLANVKSNNLIWVYVVDNSGGNTVHMEISSRVYFTDY